MKKKIISILFIMGLILCACGSERKAQKDIDENSNHNESPKATAETPDIIEASSDSTVETSDSKEEPVDHFPDINIDTIEYAYVCVDQDVYSDLDSLLDASELIVKGKVQKHTYVEVGYESWIPIDEILDLKSKYTTVTKYEIEVEKTYFGNAADTIVLTMFAVPMNYEKEKQVKVIKEAAEMLGSDEKIVKYLAVPEAWNDFRVEDGNEYLFCLRECNGTWITVDYGQGIYRLDDPTIKDHWGFLSAEEILKVFE